MSTAPATFSTSSHSPRHDLLALFLQQLSWLTAGAHETKRVFNLWLLASPPPPSGPAATLAQARRMTGRHLSQLEQLLQGLALPTEGSACEAITVLLQEGTTLLRSGRAEAERYEALMTVVQRISACFGTACASTAETAIVLGRVDLAAVLGSWAAASRSLQHGLGQTELPLSTKPAAPESAALSA